MRHGIIAIVSSTLLVIIQVAIATPYPLALITFAAWMWWTGPRKIAPWAVLAALILDLYSPLFGTTLIEWIIVLSIVALVSLTVLTDRSLLALFAVTVGTYIAGSIVHWSLWYSLSFIISTAPGLNIWNDVRLFPFGAQLIGTMVYSLLLWLIFTRGKRARRVFLVSDQAL